MDGGDYVGNYGDDDEDGGDAFGDDGGACAPLRRRGGEGKGREGTALAFCSTAPVLFLVAHAWNNQCSALTLILLRFRLVICSCCSDEGETF